MPQKACLAGLKVEIAWTMALLPISMRMFKKKTFILFLCVRIDTKAENANVNISSNKNIILLIVVHSILDL